MASRRSSTPVSVAIRASSTFCRRARGRRCIPAERGADLFLLITRWQRWRSSYGRVRDLEGFSGGSTREKMMIRSGLLVIVGVLAASAADAQSPGGRGGYLGNTIMAWHARHTAIG